MTSILVRNVLFQQCWLQNSFPIFYFPGSPAPPSVSQQRTGGVVKADQALSPRSVAEHEISAANAFDTSSPHTFHELCVLCPSPCVFRTYKRNPETYRKPAHPETYLSPAHPEQNCGRWEHALTLPMKGCWPGRLGRRNQSCYQGVPPVMKPDLSHSALRWWIYCPSPSSLSYFLSSRARRGEFSLSHEELPSSLRGSSFFYT